MEPLAPERKTACSVRFAMPRGRARRVGCRFRLPEDAAEYDQQVDAAAAGFVGNGWFWPERRAYVVARFLRGRCPLHCGGDASRAVRGWEARTLRSGQGDQRTRHQRRQTESGDFLGRPRGCFVPDSSSREAFFSFSQFFQAYRWWPGLAPPSPIQIPKRAAAHFCNTWL